ncbi:MAG: hypothetical protein ACK475_01710, partial [Bacteroidota bacterium]
MNLGFELPANRTARRISVGPSVGGVTMLHREPISSVSTEIVFPRMSYAEIASISVSHDTQMIVCDERSKA